MYRHETPDDGSFSLYHLTTDITYIDLFDRLCDCVYKGDGFSVNRRSSGIFTVCAEKVGKPFCDKWNYTPRRYIYQQFNPLLEQLRNDVQMLTPYRLTDAIVNIYGEGDFIAYHKDYHEEGNTPISIVCSFEADVGESHTMEFYRTLDEPKTNKKDRSTEGYTLKILIPDRSVSIMEGMQRRYVHMIHPGKARISVVFRTGL
jgi:alkylated DNA repair dioxygenase AlkB